MAESTPAGWYPDPQRPGQQRYWDGNAWTDHYAPISTGSAPTAGPAPISTSGVPTVAPAKKPSWQLTVFILGALLLGCGVIAGVINDSLSTDEPTATTPAGTVTAPSQAATQEPAPAAVPDSEPAPEPDSPPSEKPADSGLTMGQRQAIAKAESYLEFTAFSRKGLIDQLIYEGFSKEDAKFAVDRIDPDWNEQAAKKAESYLEVSSFSRQGLIDQLVYEGFTKAQAEYGVKAVGY